MTRKRLFSHCLQPSRVKFQHAITTLCACHRHSRALALFGDAKQAMAEGKSGLVETGLTGLVAMALLLYGHVLHIKLTLPVPVRIGIPIIIILILLFL